MGKGYTILNEKKKKNQICSRTKVTINPYMNKMVKKIETKKEDEIL